MRILFLTQVLPWPLDAGPKVRAYYVLRYLAEAGHEITLLSFCRPGEPLEQIGELRRWCKTVRTVPLVRSRLRNLRDGLRSVVSRVPFLVVRDQVRPMWQALGETLRRRTFDALHADQLWMASYGMNGIAPGLTVLDQHNAVFMVPKRLAERHANPFIRSLLSSEAHKLHEFEKEACDYFRRVVWVTEEDRAALRRSEKDHDSVIPIAVDPRAQPRIARKDPFRVTFLGGMHWPPNAEGISWFAENVWPMVVARVPSAVLTLIGKGAPALKSVASPRRVEFTGHVGELGQYLAETAVFVVPLRSGAGMRVKILDAWCWGLPVVSTTVGAEGLIGRNGENLLTEDEAEGFADAVIRIMRDARLSSRLVDGGRLTVERHYDWTVVYRAWDRIYSR